MMKVKINILACLQKFQWLVGHHLGHIMLPDGSLLHAHNFLGSNSCMGKGVLLHTMVGSVQCNSLYLPTWNITTCFMCGNAGKYLSNNFLYRSNIWFILEVLHLLPFSCWSNSIRCYNGLVTTCNLKVNKVTPLSG